MNIFKRAIIKISDVDDLINLKVLGFLNMRLLVFPDEITKLKFEKGLYLVLFVLFSVTIIYILITTTK